MKRTIKKTFLKKIKYLFSKVRYLRQIEYSNHRLLVNQIKKKKKIIKEKFIKYGRDKEDIVIAYLLRISRVFEEWINGDLRLVSSYSDRFYLKLLKCNWFKSLWEVSFRDDFKKRL